MALPLIIMRFDCVFLTPGGLLDCILYPCSIDQHASIFIGTLLASVGGHKH